MPPDPLIARADAQSALGDLSRPIRPVAIFVGLQALSRSTYSRPEGPSLDSYP
jgi:hypothetical protein